MAKTTAPQKRRRTTKAAASQQQQAADGSQLPHEDASDEQLKKDLASQQASQQYHDDTITARLEEMERRQKALEAENAKLRESQHQERREESDASLADRLAVLTAAAVQGVAQQTGMMPTRPSGTVYRIKRGDWMRYNTNLAKGNTAEGGWEKCSSDQRCSLEEGITQVAIAREDKTYDVAIGIPQHAIKRHVVYRLVRGEHTQVRPPFLPAENISTPPQPMFKGIGVA